MITFDATGSGSGGGASSITYSHTVGSGNNRALIVGVFEQSDSVTGVTYNGTSLTRAGTKVRVGTTGGLEYVHLFYLANPDSGANNVVVSRSTSANAFQAYSVSLAGVDQDDPLVTTDTFSSDSADPCTINLTTERGDWAFVMVRNASATTISDDSNYSTRFTASSFNLFDSNGATRKAKAYSSETYDGSFDANGSGNAKWGAIGLSVREARPERSMRLSGTGQSKYVSNPTGDLDITGDFTMAVWAKLEGTPAGDALVSRWVGGSLSFQWRFENATTMRLYATSSNSGAPFADVTVSTTLDEWAHWAITYDASAGQIEVFKDGVSQGTATGTLPTSIHNGSADFVIGGAGAGSGGGSRIQGAMKYLRVWDSVITDAEIVTEKDSRTAQRSTDLIFDADLGNNSVDLSTNAYSITTEGSPTYPADSPFADSITSFSDGNWSKRVKVTVDETKVPGDVDNFPIYVDLSDMPATFSDEVQADGDDIRVTYNDGKTEVPTDLVNIDTTGDTGELHALFEEDLFGDMDSELFVYYGNSSATAYADTHTLGSTNVWNDCKAVYHMEEDPSGTAPQMLDSTFNSYDLTAETTMTGGQSEAEDIGNAIHFDGSNDAFTNASGAFDGGGMTNVSITARIKPDSTGSSNRAVASMGRYAGGYDWAWILDMVSGSPYFSVYNEDSSPLRVEANGASTLSTSVFSTYTGVADTSAGVVEVFLNGVSDGSSTDATMSGLKDTSHNTLYVGRYENNFGDKYWDGYTSELRIRDTVLSDDFVTAEHNNLDSPSTFYSVGAEESSEIFSDVKNSSLATDLKAFWEFEETSGTRVDSHGSNDLTDDSSVGSTTGKCGTNAVDFVRSSSDSLSIADNADVNPTGDTSFACWFKLTTDTSGQIRAFFGKDGGATTRGYASWFFNSSGTHQFKFFVSQDGSSSEELTVGIGSTLSTGTWYHVVGVWDASTSTIEFFLDGVSVGTATGTRTAIHDNGASFYVGRFGNYSGDYTDMAIDDMGLWHRKLTNPQITGLYNGGTCLPYEASTPVLFYPKCIMF